MWCRTLITLAALASFTGGVAAQEDVAADPPLPAEASIPSPPPETQPLPGTYGTLSPILTIDREKLFLESDFGRRVQRELERDQTALAAENRRIEGELISEEQALTVARATTPVAEFTTLASQFDEKVQKIRGEQDQKSLLLQRRLDQERSSFLNVITPILGDIAQSRRAVAILDRNVALLALEGIDITDIAIGLINERLGEGGPQNFTPPQPRPQSEETLESPVTGVPVLE